MKAVPKITEKVDLDSKDNGLKQNEWNFAWSLRGFFYLRKMKELDVE